VGALHGFVLFVTLPAPPDRRPAARGV